MKPRALVAEVRALLATGVVVGRLCAQVEQGRLSAVTGPVARFPRWATPILHRRFARLPERLPSTAGASHGFFGVIASVMIAIARRTRNWPALGDPVSSVRASRSVVRSAVFAATMRR